MLEYKIYLFKRWIKSNWKKHWVWIIPSVPLLFALFTTGVIFFELKPTIDLSSQGLRNLEVIYGFPLRVFAFSIVLFTICLTTYRTQKADKQIALSETNAVRNNYNELVKSFDAFNKIQISLSRNINYFYPEINKGKTVLSDSILYEFEEIIEVIESLEKHDLGTYSGLRLVPLISITNNLKEDLIFSPRLFGNIYDPIGFMNDLVLLSYDYINLIEFHSNFHQIRQPFELNNLTRLVMEHASFASDMKDEGERFRSFIFAAIRNQDESKILDAPFINNENISPYEEIFWQHFMIWFLKQNRVNVHSDLIKKRWGTYRFYNRMINLLKDEDSDLTSYLKIRSSLIEAINSEHKLERVWRSRDFKRIIKIN